MEFYRKEDTSRLRQVISWIVDIVVVVAFAWFTLYSFGTQFMVTGHSMQPLLEADDVVLMNRMAYVFGTPDRFDVAVFEGEGKKTNIKRIIGLPGETVQIKSGYIYIDGQLLRAEHELNRVSLAGVAEQPVHLGQEEYFVLGDNRDNSDDSRFVNIGNVSSEQIMGKVWFRLMPLRGIGFLSY